MREDIRKILDRQLGAPEEKQGRYKYASTDKRQYPLGSVQYNDQGSCLVIEHSYPLTYVYGGYALGYLLGYDSSYLEMICKDPVGCCGVRDLVFLDTETTGLSGGAGTAAFLVGIGYFEEKEYVIRQFFMRDYDDETAILQFLNESMEGHKGVVTFNGKAFDWNILTNRYVSNRMKPVRRDPLHFDLLYPSRRIWKLKLESCRLTSLEENILGEYRVDDIPGGLIPQAYFEYLGTGRFDTMECVIAHNKKDILSMVAVLTRICSLLRDPMEDSGVGPELYGAGSIFQDAGRIDMVIECLEGCMCSNDPGIRHAALLRLSAIYKRKGEYQKAVAHWEEHRGSVYIDETRIYSMTELAKYYEHTKRDYEEAYKVTEEALSSLIYKSCPGDRRGPELRKRLDRLEKKMHL